MNDVIQSIYENSFNNRLVKIANDNGIDPTALLEKVAKEKKEPTALSSGLGLYGRALGYGSALGGIGGAAVGAIPGIITKNPQTGSGYAAKKFVKSRTGKDISLGTGLKESLVAGLKSTGHGIVGAGAGAGAGAGIGALIAGKKGAGLGAMIGGMAGSVPAAAYGYGQAAKHIEKKYSK
jgi:hypothetical protein